MEKINEGKQGAGCRVQGAGCRVQGEVNNPMPSHQSPVTNHQSPVPSHLFSEYMLQKSKNWVNKCQAMQRILKESQRNKLYPQESVSLNI
ncbi:MAG: hypothetical protein ACKPEO_17865 [Sphaerospermopsis kisseleviana]